MKRITMILAVAVVFVISARGQGFGNLNFEAANVSGDSIDESILISSALPGWSGCFINSDGTDTLTQITYDGLSTGGAVISIIDTNVSMYGVSPLQGNYSVLLTGGGGPGAESDLPTSAQISQTGLVPSGTQSLLFDAFLSGPSFTVTLGGQTINMVALQTFSNYTLYGGDIPSSLAGEMETLSFSEPPFLDGHESFFELDNIQFSASPVPEPGALALSALGGACLAWRRWRKLL